MSVVTKIVVFDLDETLGYFVEFGMFFDALKNYLNTTKIKHHLDQSDFNEILDLYPEFLRPNIVDILKFLKNKKKTSCCSHIMIYTNNQGPKEWADHIKKYFETKVDYKLFDQIISAFKVNGKRVEICRTTNYKTHKDFVRCTKIQSNAQICFLDDTYYPDMTNDNVYYINLKPYIYDISFDVMIRRFINSSWFSDIIGSESLHNNFYSFMVDFLNRYHYSFVKKNYEDIQIDEILSKKVMQHLMIFFEKSKNISTRRKRINNQKTKKNR